LPSTARRFAEKIDRHLSPLDLDLAEELQVLRKRAKAQLQAPRVDLVWILPGPGRSASRRSCFVWNPPPGLVSSTPGVQDSEALAKAEIAGKSCSDSTGLSTPPEDGMAFPVPPAATAVFVDFPWKELAP